LLHTNLARIYDRLFRVEDVHEQFSVLDPLSFKILNVFEERILRHEESCLPRDFARDMPSDGTNYVEWLLRLINSHQARKHVYFSQFLPHQATREDLEDFFIQETTLDPRFDDALALLQVGTQGRTKMEIAKNYWDEMGNGTPSQVHTTMFARALDALGITPEKIKTHVYLESLICGNLSLMMTLHRHRFYKAIGYFGVTEYLAPARFTQVVNAWTRNHLDPRDVEYHRAHIRIDAQHATAWFYDVIRPRVDISPANGLEIAKGALIRLESSKRYLDVLLAKAQARSRQREEGSSVEAL
jgi:pyrroloquinoline quinone (PQQ) biosynthesis protein C